MNNLKELMDMARKIYQPTETDKNYSGISDNNDITVVISNKFQAISIIANDELLNTKPLDIKYLIEELQVVFNNTLTIIENETKDLLNKNDDYKQKLIDMANSFLGKEMLDKINQTMSNQENNSNKAKEMMEKNYTGVAGAGDITVTINNKFKVQSIEIKEEYDLPVLLDLIKHAFNNAIASIMDSIIQ